MIHAPSVHRNRITGASPGPWSIDFPCHCSCGTRPPRAILGDRRTLPCVSPSHLHTRHRSGITCAYPSDLELHCSLTRGACNSFQNTAGKMLHEYLRSCIGGIESGKSTQQSSHDGDDLAVIRDVAGSCFENEKGRLGIDSPPVSKLILAPISTVNWHHDNLRQHRIIFLLRDIGDRLLQYLAHRVHHDVDHAKVLENRIKQFVHGSRRGQIALVDCNLQVRVLLFQLGFQFGRIVLATRGIIVEGQVCTQLLQARALTRPPGF